MELKIKNTLKNYPSDWSVGHPLFWQILPWVFSFEIVLLTIARTAEPSSISPPTIEIYKTLILASIA